MNSAFANLDRHPDRDAIQAEVHARPPLPIELSESEVWHWVLFGSDESPKAWPALLRASRRHQILELDEGIIRFERHTEFVALTYCGSGPPSERICAMINDCPGQLVAGLRILISEEPRTTDEHFTDGVQLFGGLNTRYNVHVTTDFRVQKNGLVTYELSGHFESAFARGNMVKRIIDLETYRNAALLALPLVRRHMDQLKMLEDQASRATEDLTGAQDTDLGITVTQLASILERLGTLQNATRFRVAASQAYYDIVKSRLDKMDERPLGHRSTLTGFIEYRLEPAIKTIFAFQRRTDDLFWTVRSAMALARTRLDLVAQQQNKSLLEGMNQSARQQVHLAQAVEGLSTAAITYYAVGLLAYLLKGFPDLFIKDSLIIAGAVPIIALLVWTMTKRATRKIKRL